MKCSLASNKSSVLHQRHLEFSDSHDHSSFPPLHPLHCQKSGFFSYLHINEKNIWRLTLIKTSTVLHISVQVSCTPNCLLCGFVLLWRAKCLTLNISIKKTPNYSITFSSANSISNTMQDKLLLKSTELKM